MRLTEKTIKNAPPGERPYKLFDGGGLHLFITPRGGKYWRYRYRFDGQDCTLSLGVYPKVRLKQARQLHRDAQSLLAQDTDPHRHKQKRKQAEKQQDNFEKVAREWYAHQRPAWKNEKHAWQVIHTLEQYVFPHIGSKAVSEVQPPAIVSILNRLADRPETRTRVKQRISAVFAFAIQTGRATLNPALSAPKTVRSAQNRVRHQPSLPAAEIPTFFQCLDNYPNRKTALALRLLILTLTRSGEVRLGQWAELNGDQWHIPAERMKMGIAHVVPLSDWALATLDELRALNRYNSPYFITGNRNQPLSDTTLSLAMKRMGYGGRAVPHGFRAMGSSILNESGQWNPDAIERQLAHREGNQVRAAYNRAEYLEERQRMMQWYADYLRAQISSGG